MLELGKRRDLSKRGSERGLGCAGDVQQCVRTLVGEIQNRIRLDPKIDG